jgi:hypothetical protein
MDRSDELQLTRQQVLVAMGVTALVLGAIAKVWLWLGNLQLGGWVWSPLATLQGVGLGLGIVLASHILYRLWPTYRTAARQYMRTVIEPLAWPDLLWLGLLPALSEELLFRGVVLLALGLTPLAVGVSSVVFGSLHLMDWHQWPYGLWAMAIGVALGSSVLLTGNLLVPVVAHTVANMLSGYLWKAVLAGRE